MIEITSVFIAEDEEGLGTLYQELLKLNGFDVLALVKSDSEISKKFSDLSEDPNLFILGNTPNLNGLNASKEILKRIPEAKILFTSNDEKIKIGMMGGNLGILIKPFQLDTFVEAVNSMVAQTPSTRVADNEVKLFKNGN